MWDSPEVLQSGRRLRDNQENQDRPFSVWLDRLSICMAVGLQRYRKAVRTG